MLKDTYILFVKPTKVDVEPKKIVFCATRQGEVAKKKKKKKKRKNNNNLKQNLGFPLANYNAKDVAGHRRRELSRGRELHRIRRGTKT
jgi:hypothetical protein